MNNKKCWDLRWRLGDVMHVIKKVFGRERKPMFAVPLYQSLIDIMKVVDLEVKAFLLLLAWSGCRPKAFSEMDLKTLAFSYYGKDKVFRYCLNFALADMDHERDIRITPKKFEEICPVRTLFRNLKSENFLETKRRGKFVFYEGKAGVIFKDSIVRTAREYYKTHVNSLLMKKCDRISLYSVRKNAFVVSLKICPDKMAAIQMALGKLPNSPILQSYVDDLKETVYVGNVLMGVKDDVADDINYKRLAPVDVYSFDELKVFLKELRHYNAILYFRNVDLYARYFQFYSIEEKRETFLKKMMKMKILKKIDENEENDEHEDVKDSK